MFSIALRERTLSTPDDKNHGIDELKRVLQHQPLHLAVVHPAPVGPREKRPADLQLVAVVIVAERGFGPVVAGRPDDLPRRAIDCH